MKNKDTFSVNSARSQYYAKALQGLTLKARSRGVEIRTEPQPTASIHSLVNTRKAGSVIMANNSSQVTASSQPWGNAVTLSPE